MRWKSLNPLEAYAMRLIALEERKGETRIVRRFLLRPTAFKRTDEYRWLEWAYIHQQIREDGYGYEVCQWRDIEFVTEAEYMLNFKLTGN